MMKKFISVFLVSLFLIMSTVTSAFASTSNDLNTATSIYNADTVITEENMADILKAFGLDLDKVIKGDEQVSSKPITTVGELEAALSMIEQMNNAERVYKPIDADTKTTLFALNFISGTKTVYSSAELGDIDEEVSATGEFEIHGEEAYWTRALGGNVTISSVSGLYTWKMTDKTLTNIVRNPYTISSYLEVTYSYTAHQYVSILGALVEVAYKPVSGYVTFADHYYI